MPKKGFEFVSSKKDDTIIFKLGLILLPAYFGRTRLQKKLVRTRDISCIKMIFALLTKVATLYIRATIVSAEILALKSYIPECKICFSMFLALNK